MLRRDDLLYPELSYNLMGVAFKVYNELGWGHNEKYYQRAFALELNNSGISFEREKGVKVDYLNRKIGNYFLDFVVDGKIVVELKTVPKLGYAHIGQIRAYLKALDMKLGLLIYFTREGVKYRRVINLV